MSEILRSKETPESPTEVESISIQQSKRRVSPSSLLFPFRGNSPRMKSFNKKSGEENLHQRELGCSWNELPEAVLRLIFAKLEAEKVDWESIKTLYAASGACKTWRAIGLPLLLQGLWEKPSKLDLLHPAQLFSLSPYEDGTLIKCYIVREEVSVCLRGSFVRFNLYLESENSRTEKKFLLSAIQHTWKQTYIYLNQSGTGTPCAKLSSSVLGTTHDLERCPASVFPDASLEPTLKDSIPSTDSLASVKYKLRMKGMMRPRRLNVLLPMPNETLEVEDSDEQASTRKRLFHSLTRSVNHARSLSDFFTHKSEKTLRKKSMLQRPSSERRLSSVPHMKLVNKPPHWNEGLKCWCLNFRGRVKLASVKNFQLTSRADRNGKIVMQFGKVDANTFILDFNPAKVSAVQAFSIALTSFEGRVLL